MFLGMVIYASYQHFHNKPCRQVLQIKSYVKYTVKSGDSIYAIAEKFKPKGEDLSDYVNLIQFENNKQEFIAPGEELDIPVY
jgi:LysM repeat protein